MSTMSIRKQQPTIIKHKERFKLHKHSVLWDLLDPARSNKQNTHHRGEESAGKYRESAYPAYLPE